MRLQSNCIEEKKQSIVILSRPGCRSRLPRRVHRLTRNVRPIALLTFLSRRGVKSARGHEPGTIHTGQCQKEEEATALVGPALLLVSMDWFEVKGSPTDERSEESPPGFTQCLMVTDGQTGYVAAIPCPEKKNQAAYLCEMIVKFLKLMRHTEFRLRADNEPALVTVVEAVKGVWPHFLRVD